MVGRTMARWSQTATLGFKPHLAPHALLQAHSKLWTFLTWHPKAGGRKICSEIHEFIHSIGNKEELPEAWKESFILPIHKKGDKTDCNNRCISLLSITYTILYSILHSRLTPYVEEITVVSSVLFSTQQVNYWSYILHLSNTWEKMGIQWSSASATYRLPESL